MTPAEHLSRYPKARPSTIAYMLKREQTTEQLRREIAASKTRPWWAFWRKL